jgi:hypothetical protein
MTDLFPIVMDRACGARIWSMFHCRDDNGSPPAAATVCAGRRPVRAVTGAMALLTASTAPTASMPAVPRSAVANEPLLERTSTAPTAP